MRAVEARSAARSGERRERDTMVPYMLAEIYLRARISGLFERHFHTLTSQREAQSFGDLGVHCRSHILVVGVISVRRSGCGTNARNHQISVPPEAKTRFRGEVLVVCPKNWTGERARAVARGTARTAMLTVLLTTRSRVMTSKPVSIGSGFYWC